MRSTLLHEADGLRTYALVFDTDDDVLDVLLGWTRGERIVSASFTAIGACRSMTLGFFDLERREYDRIEVSEQVELLSLVGNVAETPEGEPKVHAHAVIGSRDGRARGGHLLGARVRPTLELILTEHPPHLKRSYDAWTGLPLLVARGTGTTT